MEIIKILALIVVALLFIRALRLMAYSVYEFLDIIEGECHLLVEKIGKELLLRSCAVNFFTNIIFLTICVLAMVGLTMPKDLVTWQIMIICAVIAAALSFFSFILNKKIICSLDKDVRKIKRLSDIKEELKDKFANSEDNSNQAVMLAVFTAIFIIFS